MLVLSRRIGEQIVIDGNITVTVVEIKGSQVRLGVSAPKTVRVDRREVHVRRQEELAGMLHEELAGTAAWPS
ncbi:MAG: carbon storage regulator CsrA [Gemmataceae bacterium]|nr:carbon storage regulator CsrA [Gemmataceae bacterium]